MSREDGGPAFPSSYWATPESDQPNFRSGISMRDYFAGQALVGLIAMQSHGAESSTMSDSAIDAYNYADAMLERRKK